MMIKIGISLIFGFAVISKLSGKLNAEYIEWNLGLKFMYALGAVETLSVIGLYTKYSNLASYILLAIMVGALFTLVSKREPLKRYITALIALSLLIAHIIIVHG